MGDWSAPLLHIHLLGELDIRREDASVPLPPSRKARALLAYLVLTGRAQRREHLCDLLWDVADDPRAGLRWTLSKLRDVVDDDVATRILADRDEVAIRVDGARVDVLEVRRALAGRSLAALATPELERLVALYRGELLEGLDLPEFDGYQAWCVAQREDARGHRARLLAELVHRLASDPERAVTHARDRVLLDAHDVDARIALIDVLARLGRRDEARAQYTRGRRLAAEQRGGTAATRLDEAWAAVEAGPVITAPVAATLVAAASPRAEATGGSSLIGRSDDLAVLDDTYRHAASTRRLSAVLVAGALGMGKSRLADDWLRAASGRGVATVKVAAFAADAGRPYGAWLDLVTRLPGADARPRPELAQLARTTSVGHGASPDRDQLFEGIADTISAAAMAVPGLVLVIDDAHWLDPGSSALLLHVARRCEQLPVLCILLARPGELDDNSGLARSLRALRQVGVLAERELRPLGRDDTAALVRSVRADVDVESVYARSGGNPLFALELAYGQQSAHSVTHALRDRLEALSEDASTVLRWGAVMRRGFGAPEVEALTGVSAELVVDSLELLERSGLLEREGAGHVFAHELVRQVVYDALSEPRRRLMHRRLAEYLAARVERGDPDVDVADVAHHAAAAHDSALAVRTCLAAARRSLRVFAHVDAHGLARRGLRHVEALADPERTQYSLELFEVMLAARRPDDRERVGSQLEALAERALDLGTLEHARLGYHMLAYVRWERGSPLDAHRHMRHAQLISRGGPEPEQILGMAEAARCLVLLERDLPEAQALALEAAARGRIAGVEPPATFAALGMLELHRGKLVEARTDLDRSLALSRVRRDRHDEYQAIEQLVTLELTVGDLAAARARAEELAALGERFAEGSEAPFARGLVALVRSMQGDEADDAIDRALDTLAEVDAKHRLSFLASRAAQLDLERGDHSRAILRARRALDAALALQRPTEISLARYVLARANDGDVAKHLDDIVARWHSVAAPVRESLRSLVRARTDLPDVEPQEEPS